MIRSTRSRARTPARRPQSRTATPISFTARPRTSSRARGGPSGWTRSRAQGATFPAAPRATSRRVKTVIVGGGHQGLVCAAHLAGAGVDVTVLEHAPRAGGAVASHAQTLPGFVHDTCSGFYPLTLASPAFDGLGVRERIEWVDPPVAMAHPFADGSAIVLARELERTAASLDAAAPGTGRAWRAVVSPLLARRDRVLRATLTPAFPSVRDAAALALALRRDTLEIARRMLASTATLGRELFGDERAAA